MIVFQIIKRGNLAPFFIYFSSIIIHFIIFYELKDFTEILCPPPSSDGDFYTFLSKLYDINSPLVENEPFYYSPLYIYIIRIILKFFDYNIFYIQIFNILLGSSIPVAIYLTLKIYLKNLKVVYLITFLSLIFDSFLLYDITILKTTTGIALIIWGIYFLSKSYFLRNKIFLFISGIFFSLSVLIYANLLLFLIIISLYLFINYKKKVLYFLIPVVMVLSLTTLRNFIVSQDFILITSIGGIHFFIGNNLKANGIYKPVPNVRPSGFGHYFDAKKIAERELNRKLKPAEVSDFWKKKAIFQMEERPLYFAKLYIHKLWYLFNYYDIPNNINKNFIKMRTFFFKNFTISFGIISLFGLAGFLLSLKNKKFLIIHIFFITYAVSIVLFFINDRYRLPIIFPLFVYAGYLIEYIYSNQNFKSRIKVVVLILILSIPVFYKTDISKINYNILYSKFEKISSKLCYLKNKLKNTKDNIKKSEIFVKIAFIYQKTNSYEQAYYLAKKAWELNPNNKVAYILMQNLKKKIY